MANHPLLLSVLLLSAVLANGLLSSCPAVGVAAVSDSLTVSSNGVIPLQQGNDIQCYNYTLTKPFDCAPSVAIGIAFLIQLSTIFRVWQATTSSFPSRLSTRTAME